jgi:hypothetical protein
MTTDVVDVPPVRGSVPLAPPVDVAEPCVPTVVPTVVTVAPSVETVVPTVVVVVGSVVLVEPSVDTVVPPTVVDVSGTVVDVEVDGSVVVGATVVDVVDAVVLVVDGAVVVLVDDVEVEAGIVVVVLVEVDVLVDVDVVELEVVVVPCCDAHVCDRLNVSGNVDGSSVVAPSATPPSRTSSVGVDTYACIAFGGPNDVTVTVPAFWKNSVSDVKMYLGPPPPPPPPASCGSTKCHTTPPGGTGIGKPEQFWVNWLPCAFTPAWFRLASGLPGTSV